MNPLQFDALQRFIKKLETDAVQTKRIAKEARLSNIQYDQRVKDESQHDQNIKNKFKT